MKPRANGNGFVGELADKCFFCDRRLSSHYSRYAGVCGVCSRKGLELDVKPVVCAWCEAVQASNRRFCKSCRQEIRVLPRVARLLV